jgi:phage-related protein
MGQVQMRDLVFIGSSRKDLKAFPEQARQRAGFGFYLAQIGEMDDKAVPMKGFGGASVVELRIDEDGDTYRGVYTVAFADAVYVLH